MIFKRPLPALCMDRSGTYLLQNYGYCRPSLPYVITDMSRCKFAPVGARQSIVRDLSLLLLVLLTIISLLSVLEVSGFYQFGKFSKIIFVLKSHQCRSCVLCVYT